MENKMSDETKTFPTLLVCSTITGIGFLSAPFSALHECAEWIAGGPLWAREFADLATVNHLEAAAREAFPGLPTRDEAEADHESAGRIAVATYGDEIAVPRGNGERTASPRQTLTTVLGSSA